MNYREKLYSIYISTHTLHLYGKITLEEFRKAFPAWRWYYGRFLPQDKNIDILDIGCGNGGFVYFLQSIGFKNTYGIDISKEQVELAHKLGIENVVQSDAMEFLRDRTETYDVIFARDLIEHFAKDEIFELLERVYSALKNNGLFIIQTPNGESPFGTLYRYGDFSHEVAFTRSSLNQILRVAGFGNTEFYPMGPVPKGLKSIVRYILWKGINTLLKFYTAIETGSFSGIFTQNILAIAKK
jgi:2-polyprenyl-3-methyl-5-hydroxy-6-metoxy-1,4-benzoquinol methylase